MALVLTQMPSYVLFGSLDGQIRLQRGRVKRGRGKGRERESKSER
jgi:hypothetical protein